MNKSTFSMMVVAIMVPMTASAQTSAQATTSAAARATSQTTMGAADASAEARIRASINRAEKQGVPRSTLEDRVAEGRAKGASSARIAAAVEHRAEVLARVNAAMASRNEGSAPESEATHASELTAAADAYESGVSLSSITEIAARSGDNRAVALNVLASLVASGNTAPSEAVLRVDNAIRAGGSALATLAIGRASSAPAPSQPAPATAPKAGASVTSTTGVIIHH